MAARLYAKKTAEEVAKNIKMMEKAEKLLQPREAGNLMRYFAKRSGIYDGF